MLGMQMLLFWRNRSYIDFKFLASELARSQEPNLHIHKKTSILKTKTDID